MKNKKGSFSDKQFENGGQCGRTYPSHILRECPPGLSLETCNHGGLFGGKRCPFLEIVLEKYNRFFFFFFFIFGL